MAEVSPDVVISYSTKDQGVANAIYGALKKENIRCWMSTMDLVGSDNFVEKIMEAIFHCQIVIFVYSANATGSRYAQMEVHTAISNDKKIIPFKIGEVRKDNLFELLLGMNERIDASSPPYDQHIAKLVRDVQKLLADQPGPTPEPALVSTPQPQPVKTDSRKLQNLYSSHKLPVLALLVVLVALLIGGSYYAIATGNQNRGVGPGTPAVQFTSVPAPDSSDLLAGKVTGVSPSDYRVMVLIFVSGWWNKPSWDDPLTAIKPDGAWECDVNTGLNDKNRTAIAVFVVPANYETPKLLGQQNLPSDLYQKSVANTTTYV